MYKSLYYVIILFRTKQTKFWFWAGSTCKSFKNWFVFPADSHHSLCTSLILMDYIDSSRVAPPFACRHRRSNRTAVSKDDLLKKNICLKAQNPSGLCFHSDQLRFLFYVCDVLFFSHRSHQTFFAGASFKHNKTKTIFMSMKVLGVTKCCITGNWTCFGFTSHPRGFHFHLRSPFH